MEAHYCQEIKFKKGDENLGFIIKNIPVVNHNYDIYDIMILTFYLIILT